MKTDDSGPLSDEGHQHFVVRKEAAIDLVQTGRRRRPASRIRAKPLDPGAFAARIGLRRTVAEHVDIDRSFGAHADGPIIARAPSALVAPTPIEPSPPALLTAAAMAGDDTPAMGAWMIGNLMPTSSKRITSGAHCPPSRPAAACGTPQRACRPSPNSPSRPPERPPRSIPAARLDVSLPGVERDAAERLIEGSSLYTAPFRTGS